MRCVRPRCSLLEDQHHAAHEAICRAIQSDMIGLILADDISILLYDFRDGIDNRTKSNAALGLGCSFVDLGLDTNGDDLGGDPDLRYSCLADFERSLY